MTNAPTPDTSPGDELSEILRNLSVLRPSPKNQAELIEYNRITKEAKDRLNRLMLIRELEAEDKGYVQAVRERHDPVAQTSRLRDIAIRNRDGVGELAKSVESLVAEIDAQLNKEETDGDVPTHSEASRP